MNLLTSKDGNTVIVKDSKTGLLGAVVCPEDKFCSVVFENGEWIHFVESETSPLSEALKTERTMSEIEIVGEAVYSRPQIPPGKIPANIQQRYVEAALAALAAFKQGEKP